MEQPGFDPRYHAVVPVSYLDRLLRCYYGNGPRDGEKFSGFEPESPGTEVVGGLNFKDLELVQETPEGYTPKGVAKRKQEAKDAHRHDPTTEGQDSSSENH
jgi:hypothetical protein|tara:strand:+ start:168 stop:470 length:303 start_codon:yes stop_codon:yes gene_type:complete